MPTLAPRSDTALLFARLRCSIDEREANWRSLRARLFKGASHEASRIAAAMILAADAEASVCKKLILSAAAMR